MANMQVFQQQGQNNNQGDVLASYLKVFGGEVLTAFNRKAVAYPNHKTITIESGKSAQFPISGRAVAKYLKAGENLDDKRTAIEHGEKLISIDGLLTADVLIADINTAMASADFRKVYSDQLGEALALSADGAVIAELAKLVVANKENITGLGKGLLIEKTLTADKMGISEAYGRTIVDALLSLKAHFSKNNVPMDGRFVYMTPVGTASLVASNIAINRDYGAVATIVDGNVTKIAGFNIIEVPHLTIGGADSVNALPKEDKSEAGHVFPSAYATTAVFVAGHESAVGTLKLKDLQLETARRPEFQADQVIAKYAMGHGGLRPEATGMLTIKQA